LGPIIIITIILSALAKIGMGCVCVCVEYPCHYNVAIEEGNHSHNLLLLR
jgi:hypothetical protein